MGNAVNIGCEECEEHQKVMDQLEKIVVPKGRDRAWSIGALALWPVNCGAVIGLGLAGLWNAAMFVAVLLLFESIVAFFLGGTFLWGTIIGTREYLSLEEYGSVHRHANLGTSRSPKIVVEAWLGGWFRQTRVIVGPFVAELREWNGTTLILGTKQSDGTEIRAQWPKMLALLARENPEPWQMLTELLELEKTVSLHEESLWLQDAKLNHVSADLDAQIVRLIALARLTGKEDPLGWGRSKHGADIHAWLLAQLAELPPDLLVRLAPKAVEMVANLVRTSKSVSRPPPGPSATA